MSGDPLSKIMPYFVPSDKLPELREFIQKLPDIEKLVRRAVQFRLVADTSAVLADIRWLAMKRKKSARTSLLEVIAAGTVDVYAPGKLVEEVEKHLPNIAAREGIEPDVLRNEWQAYKSKLKIVEPHRDLIERHSNGIDPNDAAFIALAEELQAEGILSKDKHIYQMGGQQLTLEFVLAVRDYSRAYAIELNIICMGMSLGTASVATVIAIYNIIKGIGSGILRLPDWVKGILIFTIAIVILHPTARSKVSETLRKVLVGIKAVTPEILNSLNKASVVAQQQGELAMQHYEKAISEMK